MRLAKNLTFLGKEKWHLTHQLKQVQGPNLVNDSTLQNIAYSSCYEQLNYLCISYGFSLPEIIPIQGKI